MSQAEQLVHAELSRNREAVPQASNPVIETLSADEATLAVRLEQADIPTLLMTVAHLTGDLSILKSQWRPVIDMAGVATSGMTAEVEAQVRTLCLERLRAFRDSGTAVPARPSDAQLRRIGDWFMGPVIEPYLPMVAEELVANGEDPRQPAWSKGALAPTRDFHVAIIGAGESGLCLAFRLKQAGVPFTIYEKTVNWEAHGSKTTTRDVVSTLTAFFTVTLSRAEPGKTTSVPRKTCLPTCRKLRQTRDSMSTSALTPGSNRQAGTRRLPCGISWFQPATAPNASETT